MLKLNSARIVEIHCLKYLSLASTHFGSLWRTIVKLSSARTNELISSNLALSPIQPTISMLFPWTPRTYQTRRSENTIKSDRVNEDNCLATELVSPREGNFFRIRATLEKKIDKPKKPVTRITDRKSARSHVLVVPAFFLPFETDLEEVFGKIRIFFVKRDLP